MIDIKTFLLKYKDSFSPDTREQIEKAMKPRKEVQEFLEEEPERITVVMPPDVIRDWQKRLEFIFMKLQKVTCNGTAVHLREKFLYSAREDIRQLPGIDNVKQRFLDEIREHEKAKGLTRNEWSNLGCDKTLMAIRRVGGVLAEFWKADENTICQALLVNAVRYCVHIGFHIKMKSDDV